MNLDESLIFSEHGSVDDEAVISGAAADDQTEHKQCRPEVFKKKLPQSYVVLAKIVWPYSLFITLQELYSLLENIAKATIEVFQKSAEMNSNNLSGNMAAVQGGSASNSSSSTSKIKPILRFGSFV